MVTSKFDGYNLILLNATGSNAAIPCLFISLGSLILFLHGKQSRGKSLLCCRNLRSKEKQIALLSLIDTHQPHIINANGTFHSPDINSSEFGL